MTSRRWTLAVVCLATAMLMLDIAVVNTALTDIAADLDTGLSGLQWVVDAYTLALASTVLTAGALADRLGRKRLFGWGLGVFSVASLACAFANSITLLNGARAVQGIGAALLFAVALAILANTFPEPGERARALAAWGASVGASFAVGPLVGGLLTSGPGWRWIFLVNVPIGLASLAITHRHVRESRDPFARRIDWAGQATLTGGLFALVLTLLRANEEGWSSTPILAGFAASVVLLGAFLAVEHRGKEPMLPLHLFRDRSFTGAQVAVFAISGSLFAVFLYMTLYLQNVLGLTPVETGLVYLPATVIMFVVSGATAALAEKVPPRTVASVGLVFVAAGLLLMTTVDETSSWTAMLPGLIVGLIGSGLFNPAASALALGVLPERQSGLASGVNDTFRQAGIAVGIAALGALVPAEAALGGDGRAYVEGLQDALLAGGVLAAIGAVATFVLVRPEAGSATLPAGVAAEAA